MISWINTHGVEAILIWAVVIIVSGTVPPLTSDAGFWSKWAYAILKTAALNSRGIGNALNIKMPEINLETGVQIVKKKTDQAGPEGQ